MFLQVLRPANFEDFMRHNWTFGELLTFLHEISFEDDDMFRERNEMFFLGSGVILQNKPSLPANGSAHLDDSIDLGNLSRVLRSTRFEQFGHARKTTSDVLRLRNFPRRFCEQRACAHFLSFFDDHVRARGDGITREHFFLVTHDDNLRMYVFFMLDDYRAHEAGRFIDITLDRYTSDHIAEFDLAALVGENRHVVRIPLHESLAFLN